MTQLRGERSGPTLSSLDDRERSERFQHLQDRMPAVWESWRMDFEDEPVVVVPSVQLEQSTASSGSLTQAFEERFLFLLLLLRQPRLRMVYVTSMPIRSSI